VGNFFGEKALLSEDVQQATCVATSDLKCLMLMREDFNIMLGDLKDLLEGSLSSSFNSNVSDATGIFASNSFERFKFELKDL
jgi:CRP-like cAMP-binding protein